MKRFLVSELPFEFRESVSHKATYTIFDTAEHLPAGTIEVLEWGKSYQVTFKGKSYSNTSLASVFSEISESHFEFDLPDELLEQLESA